MIATLSGALAVRDAGRIVIETGGVGYEVFVPLSTYYRLPQIGERVALDDPAGGARGRAPALRIFHARRKASLRSADEVQHVGPKLALAILSVLSPEELVAAIGSGDVERLDAVPGSVQRSPSGSCANCATRSPI